MGILLFFIALILFIILAPFGYIFMLIGAIKYKYNLKRLDKIHKKVAIEIDEIGNLLFSDIFNMVFIKTRNNPFGYEEETISSVLGKNKLTGELTMMGKFLCFILDTIDDNHCIKSIKK